MRDEFPINICILSNNNAFCILSYTFYFDLSLTKKNYKSYPDDRLPLTYSTWNKTVDFKPQDFRKIFIYPFKIDRDTTPKRSFKSVLTKTTAGIS